MSQTWVIKDTAPVDEASRVLPKINASFTTANGLEFGEAIEVVTEGNVCSLLYYLSQLGIKVTTTAADMDLSTETEFFWSSENRKTLVFDTAPTGELLAWLQKNADYHMMKYQDIHTTDSALWKQYQDYMAKGEYDAAKAILAQTQFDNKRIDASLFNTITTELTRLQNQGKDSTWSKNTMAVQEEPPANMKAGECYCKITKKLS